MQQDCRRTARGTLYLRAVHQLLDARPLILDDAPAVALLGEEQAREIRKNHKHHRMPAARALRAHVVLRSRYAEDRLAEAVARGASQYIILGAGFDTFAFRQPPWAGRIKIFEIDHPATQVRKISKLKDAGMTLPPNLFFGGMDFERESLRDGLMRHGVSRQAVSFFSWLGVTPYLREEAIDAVLRTVAEFPSQSEMVLTFSQPPDRLAEKEKQRHSTLSRIVEGAGEPFVSFYAPEAMEQKLLGVGFKKIAWLSGEEAQNRYFRNRPADLYLSNRSVIVSAML